MPQCRRQLLCSSRRTCGDCGRSRWARLSGCSFRAATWREALGFLRADRRGCKKAWERRAGRRCMRCRWHSIGWRWRCVPWVSKASEHGRGSASSASCIIFCRCCGSRSGRRRARALASSCGKSASQPAMEICRRTAVREILDNRQRRAAACQPSGPGSGLWVRCGRALPGQFGSRVVSRIVFAPQTQTTPIRRYVRRAVL